MDGCFSRSELTFPLNFCCPCGCTVPTPDIAGFCGLGGDAFNVPCATVGSACPLLSRILLDGGSLSAGYFLLRHSMCAPCALPAGLTPVCGVDRALKFEVAACPS